MSSVVVASSGAAIIFNEDLHVKYHNRGADISYDSRSATPTLYLPISPPSDEALKLQGIKVDFESTGFSGLAGAVNNIAVCIGKENVFHAEKLAKNSSFELPISDVETLSSFSSRGITVSLELQIKDSSSVVKLHSVDLTFGN